MREELFLHDDEEVSLACPLVIIDRRSLDIFLGELGPALSTAMWMELSMVKSGAVAAV